MHRIKFKIISLLSIVPLSIFAILDYSVAYGINNNTQPKPPISDYRTITFETSTSETTTYQITRSVISSSEINSTSISEPTPTEIIIEDSTESANYTTITNLEFVPFEFDYDGSQFERIYPDLPKAQHALRHKETDIEILFKGMLIDGSMDEVIQNMNEDLQTLFTQVDRQYSSEQGWYRVTALNKQTNQYWVMKKWFVPDLTESVTVEMTVDTKDLGNALAIMTHFEHQNHPYAF